jgi:ABC-2 type transport system ATP-binding protein
MTVAAPVQLTTSAAPAAPAIVCRGLSNSYGGVRALRSLDLDVPTGSVFGLLGPNGAGKTTLLHLLTGLRRPLAVQVAIVAVLVAATMAEFRRQER